MNQWEELQQAAFAKRVSRRDFMRRAAALGVSTALATGVLSRAGYAQEPKKGGTFKIGLGHGATTDSLDPATYPDQMTGTVGWGASGNSLTEMDPTGNIVGDLAESFEPSEGAKKWAFKLRKGVTFHNGKTVTAEDVVASYKHHMGPDSKSAAKSVVDTIEDIKADGDTVVFTLKGGNADFPFYASDYHLKTMPMKADGKVDWESGISTGPYSIEKFEPGIGAKLKRYDGFYGKAYFDDVEIKVIADVAARTNALTSGEIHFMDRCDLKTVNLLKKNPDVAVNEVTGYGHYIFVMNTQVAPFDNPDVRNALKNAIDREEIAKKVFHGYASPGNDNPIAPSVQYAINPEPVHTFNPDVVKELLKKAGKEGLTVDLSVSDAAFTGAVDAATLFKETAAKAGININVIQEAADSYWDAVWLKKPFCASYWNGRPTCDWMFTQAYAAEAPWNDTFWKNPRFNELLVAARSETNSDTRAKQYAEMQQLVHDDGGLINIVFNNYVSANSKAVAHGDLLSNWDVDGMKICSRWWMA
jgi:peptide/nickel transport system substrate-binding protein